MEERNMEKLPEQWETMTHQQKHVFFARNYLKYVREGEADGLYEWTPQDIQEAYQKFLMEEDNAQSSTV